MIKYRLYHSLLHYDALLQELADLGEYFCRGIDLLVVPSAEALKEESQVGRGEAGAPLGTGRDQGRDHGGDAWESKFKLGHEHLLIKPKKKGDHTMPQAVIISLATSISQKKKVTMPQVPQNFNGSGFGHMLSHEDLKFYSFIRRFGT